MQEKAWSPNIVSMLQITPGEVVERRKYYSILQCYVTREVIMGLSVLAAGTSEDRCDVWMTELLTGGMYKYTSGLK